ncbi:hypothetical protein EVAR_79367_1 [Eumeta japonica]|uniref:Uncharacterized protein n=1 Tax=Eumeta variegata TaxID=151549 RepID=A0A4C1TEU7_EUMVA|nr:hypothetical protein EVAR_79367_1 [Eumeta japonica]
MHWRGGVVIEREGMRERKERGRKRKRLSHGHPSVIEQQLNCPTADAFRRPPRSVPADRSRRGPPTNTHAPVFNAEIDDVDVFLNDHTQE